MFTIVFENQMYLLEYQSFQEPVQVLKKAIRHLIKIEKKEAAPDVPGKSPSPVLMWPATA